MAMRKRLLGPGAAGAAFVRELFLESRATRGASDPIGIRGPGALREIEIAEEPIEEATDFVELLFPNGVVMRVPATMSADSFATLVRAASSC
jgi:hypothetical protein